MADPVGQFGHATQILNRHYSFLSNFKLTVFTVYQQEIFAYSSLTIKYQPGFAIAYFMAEHFEKVLDETEVG